MAAPPLRRAGGLFPIQSGIAASPPARLGPSARYVGTSLRSTSPRGHVATRPRRGVGVGPSSAYASVHGARVHLRYARIGARRSVCRSFRAWAFSAARDALQYARRIPRRRKSFVRKVAETRAATFYRTKQCSASIACESVARSRASPWRGRVRACGEVACEPVARSRASLWRGRVRVRGEVACEPVARSSASLWRGRARVRGEVACEPVTSRSRAGEPGCGERAGSEQVWDNQRRAFSPASTRA